VRGIEAIHEIRRRFRDIRIIVLTMHNDSEYLFEAIAAGADGYLLKDDAEKDLFFAIDMVVQGRVYISRFLAEQSRRHLVQILRGDRKPPAPEPLSLRERQVLKLIAEGKSNKEIGANLCISYRTVERHRANIRAKLNLTRPLDLVKYAYDKGYA
jgi:two-component system response regulator NreC